MDEPGEYASTLSDHPDGVVLAVHAQPGRRNNAIRGVHDGAIKISVTQVAEKGKANKAIVTLLSRTFSLPKSNITLLSGDSNPRKRFLLAGATRAEVLERLASEAGR